jgi:hypothetical protein
LIPRSPAHRAGLSRSNQLVKRDTSLKGGALKKLTNLETGVVLTANIRA